MKTHQPSYTNAEYKAAQSLFSKPCNFMRGVKRMEDLQQLAQPEIAFSGKSNVGKSSLLNAILGRRNSRDMARTSKTPGRTQELNFFNLGDRLILVDMPGYGYAKVPEASRESWDRFFPQYLNSRDQLRCVFVLVDGRHGMRENDIQMMDLLNQCGVRYQIIFTKADQVPYAEQPLLLEQAHELAPTDGSYDLKPMLVSSKTKFGIPELQAEIVRLMQEPHGEPETA